MTSPKLRSKQSAGGVSTAQPAQRPSVMNSETKEQMTVYTAGLSEITGQPHADAMEQRGRRRSCPDWPRPTSDPSQHPSAAGMLLQ